MLYLIFSLGTDRYALAASAIRDIRPLPQLRQLPAMPVWLAGLASDTEGTFPVIDLAMLALSRASHSVMSTRLAVLDYTAATGRNARLGVLVEQATSTLRAASEAFEMLPLRPSEAPWLGPVLRSGNSLVQRINIDDLLPAAVRERLFAEAL